CRLIRKKVFYPWALCRCRTKSGGRSHWLQQAQGSGIAALAHFALKLKAYLHGILSRCRHRLNTSIVEGINNTIKVIKRRAYGYRDQEYFFLKIRSAFPGIPR
ncbi:transposase, partial [Bordetella holmesii]